MIDRAPLTALLAAHPDAVADVFALLATTGAREQELATKDVVPQLDAAGRPIALDLVHQILHAGWAAGLLSRNSWGEFRLQGHTGRFKLARHPGGVVGWIREQLVAEDGAEEDVLPAEIDLDGHVDALGHRYLGKATRQPDGTYHVIAILGEALARVAVRVRAQKETT